MAHLLGYDNTSLWVAVKPPGLWNKGAGLWLRPTLQVLSKEVWAASYLTHTFSSVPQEWKITRLSYEYDSEPFGKERDAAIKKLASEAGVEVTVRISHTLYDLDK